MTLRCTVLDDYQGVALSTADWSALGDAVDVRVLREHIAGHDRLAEELADSEVVVIMRERTPFPAELFARLPKLRLLITSGMRNASVDLDAAARHGVTVCGTDSNPEPPVELTWALLLGLARGLVRENTALRDGGPWQSTVGADLHGRRLGLLGLGKTGSKMARIGRAFGMEVAAWSPNLTDERAAAADAVRVTREELFSDSDFVSVHLVLGERTRGLVGETELGLMRPTAYLVNTSRAAIVDQDALARALRAGRIAGAGVDVFDEEPLPADHPFRTLPRLLATPHLGYVTQRNYTAYFTQAVEDITAFLAGEPVRRLA
ncbi:MULTISPECIES: D-2-hydroxyacid dehydrogenase family protein [Streptomyces]|uniref:D-2-hydroxyacid dehydrogenase family protein n=1 Tax=Streptomyces TaxID=1883 RepID=UPI00163CFC27|nr:MULTISPECIES: D-2-hydroxyacid dehydrogenase family protein [Streptomyces]MBC2875413.1 D-2-hydroxyacid dehydrogenase family protein [Streptomyces sp. TYQ1024]UBI40950.1 D-2-hydroxyacid dehydrogenase family protein [Streptomyces mobaraensis]UKW33435.1 D-2-hydroxyacid dehydrogenase family protein [Streptomyces sp. TYQ1024]